MHRPGTGSSDGRRAGCSADSSLLAFFIVSTKQSHGSYIVKQCISGLAHALDPFFKLLAMDVRQPKQGGGDECLHRK